MERIKCGSSLKCVVTSGRKLLPSIAVPANACRNISLISMAIYTRRDGKG